MPKTTPPRPSAESNPEFAPPIIYTAAELLSLNLPEPRMLIERLIPMPGAILVVGSHKSGKTALSVQTAIAVASGCDLFNQFPILEEGAVLIVEKDDPSGQSSLQQYLRTAPAMAVTAHWPIHVNVNVPFPFGPYFLGWLESRISELKLKLVVLDSYTALRPHRTRGADIVKVEQEELSQIDSVGKRLECTLMVIHHDSKGSHGMDWSDRTAGTYAMGAATEGQIHISRFADLPVTARERLVRFRGRHFSGFEGVLRFREDTLDYELAIEGPASCLFSEVLSLKNAFGEGVFSPKMIMLDTGMSQATAHRTIGRLLLAGALQKMGYGQYSLTKAVREAVWTAAERVKNGA
jgi:hypothetical protein